MECHTLQQLLSDEHDKSSYASFNSILKSCKTEPGTYWENDNRIFAPTSNIHDNPLATYTSLETYQPDPPTYTNLTSGGIGGINLSPFYMTTPSLVDEGILAQSYTYQTPKVEEPVLYYDEGIGSSGSSNHSSPQNIENRSSPLLKGSDRGSIVDSDFADGERVSPGMRTFRVAEVPKQQCVQCGISNLANEQWIAEGTGQWLCGRCFANKTPVPDTSNKRKKSASIAAKRGHIFCTNCNTSMTSLWRRNPKGEFVCNACGLYEKLHKRRRPLSMKKDLIQRRKRRPRNTDSKKKSETQTSRSPARTYQPPAAMQPTMTYHSFDEANHYQPLPHGLLTLPSMNNSNNILFNYIHESQNQVLQPSGLGFTNDSSRILQHLHQSS